jgi:hypothetical protein
MRYLTPLASERQTHLTANGALTLCGRAITHKWRRSRRRDDCACGRCREAAAAIGPVHVVAPAESAPDGPDRALPG